MNAASKFVVLAAFVISGCQSQGQQRTSREEETKPPEPTYNFKAPPTFAQWSAKVRGGKLFSAPLVSTSQPPTTENGRKYLNPSDATQIPNGSGSIVAVSSIDPKDVVGLLPNVDENLTIESVDSSGSVKPVFGGVTQEKGNYRLTYYYYRYANRRCVENNPDGGTVAIGIGMRITATINTNKKSLNVSGIIPLSVAASENRASGKVRIESFGITSSSATLTSYLKGSTSLDADGLKSAIESMGVIKAVLEINALKPIPQYLFIDGTNPDQCAAIGVGTAQPSAGPVNPNPPKAG